MKLNVDKLNKLMFEKADGNYNIFARMLKMNPGQLHKILNKNVGAGVVTLDKIEQYLSSINENIIDYIF